MSFPSVVWSQVQSNQNPLCVGEISDDFSDWLGQSSHQCGDGQDLIPGSQFWILQQVNHFNFITARKVAFTEVLQVRKSLEGFRGLAGDVETEPPYRGGIAFAGRRCSSCFHFFPPRDRSSFLPFGTPRFRASAAKSSFTPFTRNASMSS